MKRLSVLALSAAAMLAAGCSSDEVAVDGNSSNGGSTSNGKAYVALNLSLPSTSGAGVRADVDYNQGDPKEYNVKSLTVVYFDNSGNYIKDITYDASQLTWSTPPSTANGITTQATLPVEEMENGDKKQVLVLINNKENKVIDCNDNGDITETNKSWTAIKEKTLTAQADAKKFTGAEKDQFFMANSPLSDGTELVTVTPSTKIEEAKAQAKTVYVERAVAKVSLDKNATNFTATTDGTNWKTTIGTSSSYQNDEVTILNWTLDVTNKSEYALRHYNTAWNTYENNVGGSNGIRFKDTNHKLEGSIETEAYRTHFATDPNFDTDVTYTSGNVVDLTSTTLPFNYVQKDMTAGEDAAQVTNALTTSLYCLENTFDVAHMKEGNTTRIVVKAKYLPKSNLADGSTIADGDDWYTIGNSSLVYSGEKLAELVKAAIGSTSTVAIVADKFKAGKADITEECFTVDGANLTSEQLSAAQKAIGQVTTYKGGICYYTSLIKHFGDTYTPWDGTTNYTATTTTEDNTKNYLGRYGVVRNNSYVITLNSVTAPGKPVIPTPSNDPDDTKKYYLQTTVKIMDWAVRNNSVDF